MLIKFWGVRGSIPVPGKNTIEFGGNTTCIEVVTDGKERIIFDAGTGIRLLGMEMMQEKFGKGEGIANIFFTHCHWDHIQGFPFFAPAYVGKKVVAEDQPNCCNNILNLFGAEEIGRRLESVLRGQMDNYYFPVDLNYLPSTVNFKLLENNRTRIGDLTITAANLIHPNGVLGYRIDDGKSSVVLATDCEHPTDGSIDSNLLTLSENVDLLIYDGQYTPEEYCPAKFHLKGTGKEGFGHSTAEEGVRAAKAAGAKQLIITHHDPLHDDVFLRKMESEIQKLMPNSSFAREGMTLEI